MAEGIAIGVAATLIAAALLWSIPRVAHFPWRRNWSRWRRARVERHRAALVARVCAEADAQGIRVPVHVEPDSDPVVVTYNIGEVEVFYLTADSLQRDAMRGYASVPRDKVRRPPAPVDRWSEGELRRWLHEHS